MIASGLISRDERRRSSATIRSFSTAPMRKGLSTTSVNNFSCPFITSGWRDLDRESTAPASCIILLGNAMRSARMDFSLTCAMRSRKWSESSNCMQYLWGLKVQIFVSRWIWPQTCNRASTCLCLRRQPGKCSWVAKSEAQSGICGGAVLIAYCRPPSAGVTQTWIWHCFTEYE